jgi:hypothetical protein
MADLLINLLNSTSDGAPLNPRLGRGAPTAPVTVVAPLHFVAVLKAVYPGRRDELSVTVRAVFPGMIDGSVRLPVLREALAVTSSHRM